MVDSLHSNTGLSVNVSEPLLSARGGGQEISYTEELDEYQHKRSAFLDFDKCGFTLKGDHIDAERWIEYGLGRNISSLDAGLDTVFNGFVNNLEVVMGGLTFKRGPLLGIGNRVSAVYAALDNTTNPPTVSDRTVTTIVQDTDSQDQYGIIEKVVSTGQISTLEANQLRDAYLEENKLPESSQGINSMGAGPGISIRCECLGYGYWLQAFVYNQTLLSLTTQISDKIGAVLAAEAAVNGLMSTDYSKIEFNGVLVSAYENDDPYGLTVVKELVAYGDVNYDRFLFQLDRNRRAVYYKQPQEPEYQYIIARNELRTMAKAPVMPWAIKPGKWIVITDFLTGAQSVPNNLRKDPRMVFIESVDFTAPYGFQIEGSKSSTVKQILSQFGMKGLVS